MSKQIEIHNIKYKVRWSVQAEAYLRQSEDMINGKTIWTADITVDKNAPPFTYKQLSKSYKKYIESAKV